MKQRKEPTWTSLVVAALRARDDFMSVGMLMEETGGNSNQIRAACFHLRKRRAIDVIVNPDGSGWWYALPPEQDTRLRVVDERTPETKPRHRKKAGKGKGTTTTTLH